MISRSISSSIVVAVVTALALAHITLAFVQPQKIATSKTVEASLPAVTESFPPLSTSEAILSARPQQATFTALFMSTSVAQSILSLTLEKPLGLILEETEDDTGGVIVTEVNEGGSAFDSPSAAQLIQSKIRMVMEQDVSSLSFDDVMDAIINAPSPLNIEFILSSSVETTGEPEASTPAYEVGAPVAITVQQPETNKPDITLNGNVGDNLRKTLLSNNDIELYRGLKKKLGNCGGGGQCGFCAVELIDDEGVWGERSDYEAQRIGKNGNEKCRLACMNNIVGPVTVRTL
eukprot:CAMPEP_0172554974 /NCGR_PEP_ID=MMETSP1067-20121228/57405_1 /TAXON_ID=265564 ORGANISM="Thalassiosira punctigera, Strain Tpunct2005C2" /NCGR_SAMPLE_ID=MMETSP1067 /ASSEMBLY_ACC=CAM_ASM_000444 /LENGTH=289 /DNA_ID=CAMNT_0013343463 /DNA_START=56 /DNA_END=928 /DNA_ORIENTATION=-